MRALMTGAFGIPLVIFLILDWLTQKLRKWRNAEDRKGIPGDSLTPVGRKLVKELKTWNWTSIFTKICILGEVFFTFQVGVMKVTYIFLSWLNDTLSSMSIEVIVLLVFLIGSCMFILPPVPGVPVYVFAGILLASAGERTEGIGMWIGLVIAISVSLFTKLMACCMQYMIGYSLGKSVKVQQLIGVDKVPTRAIEKILKTSGLSLGKIAILVGGPDWPTSVTCGIVRVNLPQMLLGTLPVVLVLGPCCLAGACMAMVVPGEDSTWSMASNASTAAATCVNMVSMAYAMSVIGHIMQNDHDELAKPRPEHAAVAELTRSEQASVDMYNTISDWNRLSCCWRFILFTAVVLMIGSNGVFVAMAESCFIPFAVSSDINAPYSKDGLEGNVLNIIIVEPLPVAPVALGVFAFATLLHIIFSKAMGRKAAHAMNGYGGSKTGRDYLDRTCEDACSSGCVHCCRRLGCCH